jgi:plasmid stabilization system protein ParE
MSFQVIISGPARRDVRQAVNWWSTHRSTEQAERWYDKILAAFASLAGGPETHPVALETDLLPTGVRQMNFGLGRKPTHRILFTIVGKHVHVLRVRHVAQDLLTPDDLA